MMKLLVSLLTFTAITVYPANTSSNNPLIRVAVIDTGIDRHIGNLCPSGHASFIDNVNPLSDDNGHGTHISGIINRNAGDSDEYCLMSLKFYSNLNSGRQNLYAMRNAIRHAIDAKVKFMNISGGGEVMDSEERMLIRTALDIGIVVVVAAGNEKHNLDKDCNYFPACYDKRIIVVGNIGSASTNYGSRVNRWEAGNNVLSELPGLKMGIMSGTSQATAIATGKLLKSYLRK